jgi:hypothetical protein
MPFSSFDFDVITGPAGPRDATEPPADRNKAQQTNRQQTNDQRSGGQPEGSRKP